MNTQENYTRFNLLSIDAWRYCEGWTWNNWSKIESDIYISNDSLTPRKILRFMRDSGWLTANSKGRLAIDDDGYNIVIINKDTFEPLLALEYGCFY